MSRPSFMLNSRPGATALKLVSAAATGLLLVGVTPNVSSAAPGVADHILFFTQPVDTAAKGTIPTVRVKIYDDQPAVVGGDNTTMVSLSLSGGDAGATLGGTTTVQANGGTATFSDLTVDRYSASTYTLVAEASGLTGDTSSTFSITQIPITVTAVADSKTYNDDIDSAGDPQITGTLASGDSGLFTQEFDDQNVGIDKTLTPVGVVDDGNGGDNYDVTFVTADLGEITPEAITVTAQTDTKVYDGTTDSSVTPAITSGALQGDDTNDFIQTFSGTDVGTGYTLTPSGAAGDGNGGANYDVTFADDLTGEITARDITVTAQTDTKVYDGTTDSSVLPQITSGTIAPNQSETLSQVFGDANVGTGITLSPSVSIVDGDADVTDNYNITFVDDLTGEITARDITVTAQTDTKVYDDTTDSSVLPLITSGTLAAGQSETLSQVFDDANKGTSKTLSPSATIMDGDTDVTDNYNVTLVDDTTGEITARDITVTAQTDTKVYDGTTDSSVVPDITSGALQGDDTNDFTQDFSQNGVGSDLALTPAGMAGDGNGGANYNVTFVDDLTGAITPKELTVIPDAGQYKRYDAEDPAFTYTTSGLVVGDEDVVTGDLGREEGEKIGFYDYTLGDVDAGDNYTLALDPTNRFQIRKPLVRDIEFTPEYTTAARARTDWTIKFNPYMQLRGGDRIRIVFPETFNVNTTWVLAKSGFHGCKVTPEGAGNMTVLKITKKKSASMCRTDADTQLSVTLRGVKNGYAGVYGAPDFAVTTSRNPRLGTAEEGQIITPRTSIADLVRTDEATNDENTEFDTKVEFSTSETGRLVRGDLIMVNLGNQTMGVGGWGFGGDWLAAGGTKCDLEQVSSAPEWRLTMRLVGNGCVIPAGSTFSITVNAVDIPEADLADMNIPDADMGFWTRTSVDMVKAVPMEAGPILY